MWCLKPETLVSGKNNKIEVVKKKVGAADKQNKKVRDEMRFA